MEKNSIAEEAQKKRGARNTRAIIYNADCLDVLPALAAGSVDLVLTDPPYGTMQGFKGIDWDIPIDTAGMFEAAVHVLRQNGRACFFSQEPYTAELITRAVPALPFNYRAIWKKPNCGNNLGANKNMLNLTEDVCIFTRTAAEDKEGSPLAALLLQQMRESGRTRADAIAVVGPSAGHYFTAGKQFRIPTPEKYEALRAAGFFSMSYGEMARQYEEMNAERLKRRAEEFPAVFNLWEGRKSKSNVLEYGKDRDGLHPTQKPVALLADLIQTYSRPGDTVLDLAMGSGSTGAACQKTGRDFIGVELNKSFYDIARARLEEAGAKVIEGGRQE